MLYFNLLLLCFVSFKFCAHVSLPQKAIDWSVILSFSCYSYVDMFAVDCCFCSFRNYCF